MIKETEHEISTKSEKDAPRARYATSEELSSRKCTRWKRIHHHHGWGTSQCGYSGERFRLRLKVMANIKGPPSKFSARIEVFIRVTQLKN